MRRNGRQRYKVPGPVPAMIEEAHMAVPAALLFRGDARQAAQRGGVHDRMRAERDQKVAGLGARHQQIAQEPKEHRYRCRARRVGDDDQNASGIRGQRSQCLREDGARLGLADCRVHMPVPVRHNPEESRLQPIAPTYAFPAGAAQERRRAVAKPVACLYSHVDPGSHER